MNTRPIPTPPPVPDVQSAPRARINTMPDEPVAETVRAADEPVDAFGYEPDRVRQRTGRMNINPYDIPDALRPGGTFVHTDGHRYFKIDFNWKNKSVQGELQHVTMQQEHDQGWRPVQHSWFPGRWAPIGTPGFIEFQDSYLVERPMVLTLQAKMEEKNIALSQVSVNTQKMSQTPEGQAPRMVIANQDQRMDISIPD